MRDGAELLMDAPMARRGKRMLQALADCAPAGSAVTKSYAGRHRLLVMYGAGLPTRMAALNAHRQAGGTVATWDLGYWDRDDAMRLAVGSLHPTPQQMALAPLGQRRVQTLREDANPAGPVMLVGLGTKSAALYGLRPMQWETEMLLHIRQSWAGRRVLWRPKGKAVVPLAGTELAHGMPIEDALRGCAMVFCRHSNVAVDACIAGVPVYCEAGAAASLYSWDPAPSRPKRAEFLRRLAWWNWRPSEAPQAWKWIERVSG